MIELSSELKEIEFIQLNDSSLDNPGKPYDSTSPQKKIPPEKLRIVEVDLLNDFSIPQELLEGSIVICNDVFDQLQNPHFLIKALADARQHCAYLLITCKDRLRAEGFTLPTSENIPLGKPRWSSEQFFQQLVTNGFPPNIFFGHTSNECGSNYKNLALAVAGIDAEPVVEPKEFKTAAIINLFNEADVIESVVNYLAVQGVEVHLIDNWSEDGSYEICQRLVNEGLAKYCKRFPDKKTDHYEWAAQLKYSATYALEVDADWIVHYDADEIRCSPWPELTLNEAFQFVDSLGYSAVDFTVIDFRFTNEDDSSTAPPDRLNYFEFPRHQANFSQIKAWKNLHQLVDLYTYGGHEAVFEQRKVYPLKFLTKHYSLRSKKQAEEKIYRRRIPRIQKERNELGWHVHFDLYTYIDQIEPWSKDELIYFKELHFNDEFLIERLSGCGLQYHDFQSLNLANLKKFFHSTTQFIHEKLDADRFRQINTRLEQLNASLEQEVIGLKQLNASLEQEVIGLKQHINQLLNSRSWRFTRPLRHFQRLMSANSISSFHKLFFYSARVVWKKLPVSLINKQKIKNFALRAIPSLLQSNSADNTGQVCQKVPDTRVITAADNGIEHATTLYINIDNIKLSTGAIDAEVDAIRKSGLFDESFYLAMYPDICPLPDDPIRHYCEYGWREGRNPSDDFDTRGYLDAYSDIKNAGLNPFWHYVIAGASESRQATPDSNSRYEDDVYFGQITSDIQLIAYYASPDWHAVQQGRKGVKGAGQALMPHGDLGFYEVSEPSTIAKQALIAQRHGVSAWCFTLDVAQGPMQEGALIELMSNRDIDIEFVLDIDLRSTQINQLLVAFIENALTDERYLRIDERPVLVMTLPDDVHHCDDVLTAFYAHLNLARIFPYRIVRRDGLPGHAVASANWCKFEAVLDFPVSPIPGETGSFSPMHKNGVDFVPYSIVVSQAIARMGTTDDNTVQCYRAVTLGRDDSPLNPKRPLRYTRYRQKEYRRWLDAAISDSRTKHMLGQRLLFINAWNDWNHGAVLEPDRFGGYSNLNETSRALLGLTSGLDLPKVSVIVPNYNHAPYLLRRLESIYRQTYANIEVLLLDDCSTDQSRDVLMEYAVRYPEITMTLFNEENSGGVFRQWAKGIKAASGDLIWIAESDDYCDEDFLEKLVRCFDDEAVMLAYSKSEFVRADESVMPDEFWHHVRDLDCRDKWKHSYVNTAHQEVSEALGIINTIPNASGAIFRRPVDMSLLENEVWLSMRVVGDWIFYLHQLRGGKIAYSAETTNYFRRYEGSTAASTYKKETFYQELSFAARTVQSLYDTPHSLVKKFLSKVKEYYDFHGGKRDEEFRGWCNEMEISEARHYRTPNIAVSTMGFYPGGAEILPIRMANEFKRQGHSVILLSAGHGLSEDGVRRMLRRDIPVIETADIATTKELIRVFGIEVLNSHQWHVQKYPMQVPDVFRELKVHVASLHGMIEYRDAFGVTMEQLKVADKNVTTWVYTADKNLWPFIEHGLYEEGSPRFIKLPNGMEPPAIKPVPRSEIGMPDDAFVLCCVSRAIPDKGWSEAIEATAHARNISGKDIRLILVGNGPVYDEYCRTGVPEFVYLAGFSENSVGYYASADIGIMLTKFKSESFPLTIVDCLFAERPYIATNVGEIRNMLTAGDDVAGEVIELVDWEVPIERVASVIAAFATDHQKYTNALALVQEVANRYHIDVVASKYIQLFEQRFVDERSNLFD